MESLKETVLGFVLLAVALTFLYGPYVYYTQGEIGLPLFLAGCLVLWIAVAAVDHGGFKTWRFRLTLWAVALPIWFAALFYINTNYDGSLKGGLQIGHFLSLFVVSYFGGVLDFRLGRMRAKKGIRQSTDAKALHTQYIDPPYIAPELKKAARKRILALDPNADLTPNPRPDLGYSTIKNLSFTDDILTPTEKSNAEAILFEKPAQAFISGVFGGAVVICIIAGIIAIVVANYTLEPQGPHSPAYQIGKATPAFLSQHIYLLLLPFLITVPASWYGVYKPILSGIAKKHIVFSGNLQPDQLDALTMQRVGLKWRPEHGNKLTIYRDFNLETLAAGKGHAVVYFTDFPPPQQQAQITSGPREKLEALANDPNASPDERIAALEKLKALPAPPKKITHRK